MFEKVIFQNIINNRTYGMDFLEFLKPEYFSFNETKLLFKYTHNYFNKYLALPQWNELLIEMGNDKEVNEESFHKVVDYVEELKKDDSTYNSEWLSNETKKWIKNEAFKLVIAESAERVGTNKPLDDMLDKMQSVFSINFNETIGNSFIKDYKKQFEYYNQKREKFASSISQLDLCCDGGIERKTLNLLLAPTNTGKTSAMVSLAASYLRRGYNVLYVTCEMSEENIRQRIDANFFKIPINDIPRLSQEMYFGRMEEIAKTLKGNLYVKEYPTATANVNHIRALLDALRTKENFVPDILIIDYLNLLTSTRYKASSLYEVAKAIAEEVRGLMCQYKLGGWSATQTNRGGEGASDLDLDDTSDSYGVPMTVDSQFGLIQTAALLEQKRQMWKCLKTRYSALKNYKFLVEHLFEICTVSDVEQTQNNNNTKDENDYELKTKSNIVNNNERFKSLNIESINWD